MLLEELKKKYNLYLLSNTNQIHHTAFNQILLEKEERGDEIDIIKNSAFSLLNIINDILDFSKIESNAVRCPDAETAEKMENHILEIKKQGDTVGGTITCVIQNIPIGLGEPVFDKLHAELGKAMLSINSQI